MNDPIVCVHIGRSTWQGPRSAALVQPRPAPQPGRFRNIVTDEIVDTPDALRFFDNRDPAAWQREHCLH